MSRGTMKTIDGAALQRELKKRGITNREAEEATGHRTGYFSKIFREGRISENQVALLKALYNIDPAAYEKKEEPEEKAQVTMDLTGKPEGIPEETIRDLIRAIDDLAKALQDAGRKAAGPAVLPWVTPEDKRGGRA